MNSPKFSTRRAHNAKDMTGMTMGKLRVVAYAGTVKNRRTWLCRCECGREVTIAGYYLRSGDTKSCGCLKRERLFKHGKIETKEYRAWVEMRVRCRNPLKEGYDSYGGRGIQVCERWESFENFLVDMGERPTPAHSIDRIDNNGNYEPANCRWATMTEQANNTSRNIWVTFNGETRTLSQWADAVGLPYNALSSRIRRDWPLERALTEPAKKRTRP